MLIALYSAPEFQQRLHQAFRSAGGAGADPLTWGRARQDVCLPVQTQVLAKFGFEPNRKGLAQSVKAFTPEINADPEVAEKNQIMAWLVDPNQQAQHEEPTKPAETQAAEIRKLNPDDGKIYTFSELQGAFRHEYTSAELDSYWRDAMKPIGENLPGFSETQAVQAMAGPQKVEAAQEATGVWPVSSQWRPDHDLGD